MTDSSNKQMAAPVSEADIKAREEYILGHPPRIPPLDKNDPEVTEAAMVAWRLLREKISGGSADNLDPANIPEIYFTVLRFPELWQAFTGLSIQLASRGFLDARDREIVMLRTGWLCQAPFEWGEHVIIGKKCGLTSDDVERIAVGSSAPEWSEHDRALLRATEELHANAMISDETWNILAKRLSEEQLFELTLVAGQFTTVAYFQNSLRIPLNKQNGGLMSR